MRLVFWLIAGIFLSSCVTNKKYTLLQKDDVNVKDLPKDSVVRSYAIQITMNTGYSPKITSP
jgi:hypothetical protein